MVNVLSGYGQFDGQWQERAELAWRTLRLEPTRGIPSWIFHTMDMPFMEQEAGAAGGDYAREPENVYLAFQHRAGTCFIDQFIPNNPLSMESHGFGASTRRGATTGAGRIELDGMVIDSPEAVALHLERFAWPRLRDEIGRTKPDDPARIAALVEQELTVQRRFGPNMLKGPYDRGFQAFPRLRYGTYGYANYFMAYALFPKVMERDFSLQADLAERANALAAAAIRQGGLPAMLRLDHDMADSRGTLVDIRSLDRLWLPHFARSIRPLLAAGVRLIWHCDGNLMAMVPRLLEAGIGGFQGFQYEDGMDYPAICRMKTRAGGPLLIVAGVSVTRTLPFGSRQDVAEHMKWLVASGPRVGLFLGPSSSIVPGVPHENLLAMMEGLAHYRTQGRD